ncbi:MAG: ChaB family protein [Gammaproteobacteria bacterium]
MPYRSIDDLPDAVRRHLPVHAREIYLEAFNHAWEQYAERQDREAVAHKVAWSAVKKKYRKQEEYWVEK